MSGSPQGAVFGDYAEAYDALYRDKDYAAECDFLETSFRRFHDGKVKRVLDLGCGTGTHAMLLAQRGYHVHGVERSAEMLAVAGRKVHANLDLRFTQADLCDVALGETFEAALCMFAVLGYQTRNEALASALRSVRKHLVPGGLFICDVWYGPAVLHERPGERARIVTDGEDRIVRMSRASLDLQRNVCTVTFDLLRLRGDRVLGEVREEHPVRYFFQPELEYFFEQAGLRLEQVSPFMELDGSSSENTWNVSVIARAV